MLFVSFQDWNMYLFVAMKVGDWVLELELRVG